MSAHRHHHCCLLVLVAIAWFNFAIPKCQCQWNNLNYCVLKCVCVCQDCMARLSWHLNHSFIHLTIRSFVRSFFRLFIPSQCFPFVYFVYLSDFLFFGSPLRKGSCHWTAWQCSQATRLFHWQFNPTDEYERFTKSRQYHFNAFGKLWIGMYALRRWWQQQKINK